MPDNRTTFRLRSALTLAISFLVISIPLLTKLTATGEYFEGNTVNSVSEDSHWLDIEATDGLVWNPCYKPLPRECARLIVPLNHLNQSARAQGHATIALIRIPSPFSSPSHKQHRRYRGPILFNPGGPGASGVDFLVHIGDLFTQILGPEFDLVSFDPRGVGRSTPKIMFFDAAGKGEREVWDSKGPDIIRGGPGNKFRDVKGESGKSLESVWANAVVRNWQAKEKAGDWLGNVNTEQTAYDMLSIVKAQGRKKLMYWGFSYGTVLGSTFASLFPGKIERMVLDGVVDAENYYATLWSNNLLDTSKALNRFFETCHAAGSACAFWAPSASLIEANLTRIYEELITNPIPVRTSSSYGFLDYSTVRNAVYESLFSPWASWPTLARALSDLKLPKRDPHLMWKLTETPTFKCACSDTYNDKDPHEKLFVIPIRDAQTAIICSDGADIPSDVVSSRSYFEQLSNATEWADLWATIRISCAGWPKAKKGFQGPVGGNTSFPLLFVGNSADPVTPVVHAKTMSNKFPGSCVLTQDSPGHCSFSAPSVCTWTHIKEYFVSGNLPPQGVVCPTDSGPFSDLTMDKYQGVIDGADERMVVLSGGESTIDEETQRIKDAVCRLSKSRPLNRVF